MKIIFLTSDVSRYTIPVIQIQLHIEVDSTPATNRMVGSTYSSRKLMLLLAFLFMDTSSVVQLLLPTVDVSWQQQQKQGREVTHLDTMSYSAEDSRQVVWLVDEATGQCLGSQGSFGECGDLSLWIWNSWNDSVLLQMIDGSQQHDFNSSSAECLGRRRSIANMHGLALHRCSTSRFSRTRWTFDHISGMLSSNSVYSKAFGPSCIHNRPHHAVQSCRRGFTPLRRVVFEYMEYEAVSQASSRAPPSLIDSGSWTCPTTGLTFPRNLDHYFMAGEPGSRSETHEMSRQVFMGGGIMTKPFMGMTFTVFSMAWYVQAAAAQLDPTLLSFSQLSLQQLLSSDEFYSAVSTEGLYDRTLFVKLAMTVKTKLLLQGFLDDISMQPAHKAILAAASSEYDEPECRKGLELLFTWRKGLDGQHPTGEGSGGGRSRGGGGVRRTQQVDYFEVRIGAAQWDIREPGLAADFMRQFFSSDPVSLSAKHGFISLFPSLLSGPHYSPTPTISTGADAPSPFTATAGDSSSPHMDPVRAVKTAASRLRDKSVSLLMDTYQWKKYLNSLIDKRRPNSVVEEKCAILLVIIYCCFMVLSLLSLPYSAQAHVAAPVMRRVRSSFGALSSLLRPGVEASCRQRVLVQTCSSSPPTRGSTTLTPCRTPSPTQRYRTPDPLMRKSSSAPTLQLHLLSK